MAVQFELYKTPMPKEKKNKVRYHARPISYETVNTKKLVYRIHDRCSLSPSDVTATLEELKYEVAQCLKEGKKVHIDGLGYLQVTLSCEEEIRDPKDKRVHKVKLKAIKFKADKELKAELSDMEFHRSGDRYGIDKVFFGKPTYHPKRLPVPLRNDTNYCIPPY